MVTFAQPPCADGVIRVDPVTAPCPRAAESWLVAAAVGGAGLAFVDGTIVNVMLPTLQAELTATAADAQWVIAAYALGLAALTLTGGALGDRFGRRRVYAVGLVLFALASLWCAIAPDARHLIAARAVQGVGGALVLPGSLALIGASIPSDRRSRAIATWSGFASVAAGAGPLLGGVLLEQASWRWAFGLNLPVAAVLLAILFAFVPESRDPVNARLDWRGAASATGGLGLLVFGLIASGPRGATDPVVLGTLAAGFFVLAGFVALEARQPAPMLPLTLFRSRTFDGAALVTLGVYAAGVGTSFLLSLNLIQAQGYSPAAAGAAQLPFVAMTFGLSRWSGGLIDRFGPKWPLVVGPLLVAIGVLLLVRLGTNGGYWTTVFPAMIVAGAGMATTIAPLTATVVGTVGRDHAGLASGVTNTLSRLGGLLAVAALGVVVSDAFADGLERRLADVALPPAAARSLDGGRAELAALDAPDDLDAATADAVDHAVAEAFVEAFDRAMVVIAGVAAAGGLAALVLIDGPAGAAPRRAERGVARGTPRRARSVSSP